MLKSKDISFSQFPLHQLQSRLMRILMFFLIIFLGKFMELAFAVKFLVKEELFEPLLFFHIFKKHIKKPISFKLKLSYFLKLQLSYFLKLLIL